MNLDYLRYFVKLAETRHYTRAARQLCITQPSLSHAIRQLEGELGVPLFERSGRNTQLTRPGEEFLECARRTLDTLDQGVTSLQRSARGEGLIRLGFLRVLGTEYIPRLAARFLAAHPDREIRFAFRSDRTQALLEDLQHQRCDVVFSSPPAPELGLTAVPVTRQELVLIVPRDHPLAGRDRVDLAETLPYPLIRFSEGSGLRQVVDGLYAAVGAAPQIACENEEDQVIAGLVAQGFGIAVVPHMELLRRLDVQVVNFSQPVQWEIHRVHDARVWTPPLVEDFLRFTETLPPEPWTL